MSLDSSSGNRSLAYGTKMLAKIGYHCMLVESFFSCRKFGSTASVCTPSPVPQLCECRVRLAAVAVLVSGDLTNEKSQNRNFRRGAFDYDEFFEEPSQRRVRSGSD